MIRKLIASFRFRGHDERCKADRHNPSEEMRKHLVGTGCANRNGECNQARKASLEVWETCTCWCDCRKRWRENRWEWLKGIFRVERTTISVLEDSGAAIGTQGLREHGVNVGRHSGHHVIDEARAAEYDAVIGDVSSLGINPNLLAPHASDEPNDWDERSVLVNDE